MSLFLLDHTSISDIANSNTILPLLTVMLKGKQPEQRLIKTPEMY